MYKGTGGSALLDVKYVIDKAQIRENSKVADLGCGASGHFVFPIANIIGKRGKIYAVDILKTVLETISKKIRQENYENIVTVWSDLEIFKATKIESGSLDTALLINTLYQSHKRVEILRETIRMLKKGGLLVVVEWKNVASPIGPPIEERVKIDLLKQGAQRLGLILEDEFEAGPYHYGIVFEKM